MGASAFGGSFAPSVQFEKWEIRKVFPHFSNFQLEQNPSPKALAPLCGVALNFLWAALPRGPAPVRYSVDNALA